MTMTIPADTSGAHGSASFTWAISPAGGGCTPSQLLGNPGFESGNTVWTAGAGVIGQNGPSEPAHSGTWDAWLDGYGTTHTDTLSQTVTIPAACQLRRQHHPRVHRHRGLLTADLVRHR